MIKLKGLTCAAMAFVCCLCPLQAVAQSDPPMPPQGMAAPPPSAQSFDGNIWSGIKLGMSYSEFQKVMTKLGLYGLLQMKKKYSLKDGEHAIYALTQSDLSFNGISWDPYFEFVKRGESWNLDEILVYFDSLDEAKQFLGAVERKFGKCTSATDPTRDFQYGRPIWKLGPKDRELAYIYLSAPIFAGETWMIHLSDLSHLHQAEASKASSTE